MFHHTSTSRRYGTVALIAAMCLSLSISLTGCFPSAQAASPTPTPELQAPVSPAPAPEAPAGLTVTDYMDTFVTAAIKQDVELAGIFADWARPHEGMDALPEHISGAFFFQEDNDDLLLALFDLEQTSYVPLEIYRIPHGHSDGVCLIPGAGFPEDSVLHGLSVDFLLVDQDLPYYSLSGESKRYGTFSWDYFLVPAGETCTFYDGHDHALPIQTVQPELCV